MAHVLVNAFNVDAVLFEGIWGVPIPGILERRFDTPATRNGKFCPQLQHSALHALLTHDWYLQWQTLPMNTLKLLDGSERMNHEVLTKSRFKHCQFGLSGAKILSSR
eukprot:5944254-Amphidinium_carterae.1